MAYSKVPQNEQLTATQVPEQIMAGNYIFVGKVVFAGQVEGGTITPSDAAAAGTNQATATTLKAGKLNVVSGATGAAGTGVKLPTANIGERVTIYNAAAATLNVYPQTSGTINGGTANAKIMMIANSTGTFTKTSSINWAADYTVGS